MKKLVFDFDNTLYGEGKDNQRWLELFDFISQFNPKKIWLFSNGSKWMQKQPESQIEFEHIDDFERGLADLEISDACVNHAIGFGYSGNPCNAALPKRAPHGAILVDDLADTWRAIALSNPDATFTPDQFLQKVKNGELTLIVDSLGYLAAGPALTP